MPCDDCHAQEEVESTCFDEARQLQWKRRSSGISSRSWSNRQSDPLYSNRMWFSHV